ncbi:MAG: hypothetical protein IJ033_02415 [Clostridia bacterium]|nr:hypothetical protein [Clostridia bacterium]
MNQNEIKELAIKLAREICDLYDHCSRVGKTDCYKCQVEDITYQQLARIIINSKPEVDIHIPLKIGDIAWGIRNFHGHLKPVKGYISNVTVQKDLRVLYEIKYVCRGYFGEKIFKTEQEADAMVDQKEKDKHVSR